MSATLKAKGSNKDHAKLSASYPSLSPAYVRHTAPRCAGIKLVVASILFEVLNHGPTIRRMLLTKAMSLRLDVKEGRGAGRLGV